ncbi:hypothetical protein GGR57DRAFT_297500 [Xylariaceae sp. FL1272]|nr:hypothetical protein GGR57DRAFT_297500 [Xylariaceae sp. FL1272]
MPNPGRSYQAGVTHRDGPYHVNTNGLHGFSIATVSAHRVDPVLPNDEVFMSLAVAVDIGLEILETQSGRSVLCRLGNVFVQARARIAHEPPFAGDVNRMVEYVDYFLRRVRADYPQVMLKDHASYIPAATHPRQPTRNLRNFDPKNAASFSYNLEMVQSMKMAHLAYVNAAQRSPVKKTCLERWQNFLFILACATAHEITHLFTLYLSLGASFPATPPTISHTGYNQAGGGESGRWLEAALFGGSLELYKDKTEGPEHPGRSYVMDKHRRFYRIGQRSIIELVESPHLYRFPFPIEGGAETANDLRRRGLRNIGSMSEAPMPVSQSIRAMESLSAIRKHRGYSIHIDDLRQRSSEPGLALTVVAVGASN